MLFSVQETGCLSVFRSHFSHTIFPQFVTDHVTCVLLQVRAGLEQISTFLSSHSREVVFLDFNHFYGVQNLHHEKLVAMLREVFGDKLCPVVFAQEVLSNCSPQGGNYSYWVTSRLAPIILLRCRSPFAAQSPTTFFFFDSSKLAFDNSWVFSAALKIYFLGGFYTLTSRMMVIMFEAFCLHQSGKVTPPLFKFAPVLRLVLLST